MSHPCKSKSYHLTEAAYQKDAQKQKQYHLLQKTALPAPLQLLPKNGSQLSGAAMTRQLYVLRDVNILQMHTTPPMYKKIPAPHSTLICCSVGMRIGCRGEVRLEELGAADPSEETSGRAPEREVPGRVG